VSLRLVELQPALWPDVEALFGPKGATAGCWCQWVMLSKGESFDAVKGPEAKARLEGQVRAGVRRAILAYDGDLPVGWAAYGPRRGFDRIDRAPSLACDDADLVWSAPCFFVRSGRRGQGVATALLGAVVEAVRRAGGRVLEGYPSVTASGRAPAAFVWTGTPALFEKHGFRRVDDKPTGKVRMRLELTSTPGR
jgi:GNAT superfamily N-acetyltransferase